jgi:hypothetical protein
MPNTRGSSLQEVGEVGEVGEVEEVGRVKLEASNDKVQYAPPMEDAEGGVTAPLYSVDGNELVLEEVQVHIGSGGSGSEPPCRPTSRAGHSVIPLHVRGCPPATARLLGLVVGCARVLIGGG